MPIGAFSLGKWITIISTGTCEECGELETVSEGIPQRWESPSDAKVDPKYWENRFFGVGQRDRQALEFPSNPSLKARWVSRAARESSPVDEMHRLLR